MASTATFHLSTPSPPSFNPSFKTHLFISPHQPIKLIPTTTIKATATTTTTTTSTPSPSTKTNNWQWKFDNNRINIYFEQHENIQQKRTTTTNPTKNVLLIPTISDVSTVEEWRSVAQDIVGRGGDGNVNYKATIVDWPGLGYSDRPKLDYDADVLEKFLVDFVTSPDSPVNNASGT